MNLFSLTFSPQANTIIIFLWLYYHTTRKKVPGCGRNFVISRQLSASHMTFFFLHRGRLLRGIMERAKREHYLIPACRVTERPRPIGLGPQMIAALFIYFSPHPSTPPSFPATARNLIIRNILSLKSTLER